MKPKYKIPKLPKEIWCYLPNSQNKYEISSFGRVRSKNGILKLRSKRDKYLYFTTCINNKIKHCNIHRAVALTFIPNPKNRPCVNHLDFDRGNNKIENLEWVTNRENVDHAKMNGRYKNLKFPHYVGSDHPMSKLKDTEVLEIKRLLKFGRYKQRDLAKLFNVSQTTITFINTGRNWRHLN
jgi:hypothetical protein